MTPPRSISPTIPLAHQRRGQSPYRRYHLAQIDFRRATGTFDEHQIRLFAQRRETAEDGWQKLGFQTWYSRAVVWPITRPRRTIWAPLPLRGFKRTGFMSMLGGTRQALACVAGRGLFRRCRKSRWHCLTCSRLEGCALPACDYNRRGRARDDQRFADAGTAPWYMKLLGRKFGPPRDVQNSISAGAFTRAAERR